MTEQSREALRQEDMLRVGVISSTHGIKGEVKVYPTTDDSRRFKKLKRVYLSIPEDGIKASKEKTEQIQHTKQLQQDNIIKELEIETVRFFKQMVIIKFKGYDNINDIEKYRGYDLLIAREDAVPLAENEYFISDVIGSRAVTKEGIEIGIVEDILLTGANDVYSIRLSEGINELPEELRGGKRIAAGTELLLPSIPDCILEVDVKQKIVTVAVMKGSLD